MRGCQISHFLIPKPLIITATVGLLFTQLDSTAQFTTNSPAGGQLPNAVSPIGGPVTDLIGQNGVRIVTQLPASSLINVSSFGGSTTIGTQTGFSDLILSQLGGGLSSAAVRVTQADNDSAFGEFAFNETFHFLNGVNFGNFSNVATVGTDGVGNILSNNPAGGFRSDLLDTGFFLLTNTSKLGSFFNSLQNTNQIVFEYTETEYNNNLLDFTAGIDGGLIDVGTGVIIENASVEFLDTGATLSLVGSGLPMAAVVGKTQHTTSRTALRDVNGRIFRHRAGLNAASSAPMMANPATVTGSLSKDGKYTLPVEPVQPDFKRFELFASGDYGNQDVDRIDQQAGFDGDTWAGTVGAEFHARRNFTIGAAFTYATSDFDFSNSLGDIQIEGPSGSVYMSYASETFYADVLYNYGTFDIETKRNPIFGQRDYYGETDSEQQNAELNLGYNITLGGGKIVTGPIASLRFVQGNIEAYTEQTPGNAQIRYDQQTYESLISALGWQLSYKINAGKITIVPQVRAAWEHEYLDDADMVSAELVNSPFFRTTSTGVERLPGNLRANQTTESLGTDYLAAGAGVAILVGDNLSFTLDYEGEFFRADSASHYASLRASFRF